MELGATVCLPNGAPLCDRCPAASFCRARLENRTGELPVKAAKKARRVEERTVYLVFHGDKVALRRRPARGLLAGLWEYPNELSGGTDWPRRWGISGPVRRDGTGKHIFSHIEWHMTAQVVEAEDDACLRAGCGPAKRSCGRYTPCPTPFAPSPTWWRSGCVEGSDKLGPGLCRGQVSLPELFLFHDPEGEEHNHRAAQNHRRIAIWPA